MTDHADTIRRDGDRDPSWPEGFYWSEEYGRPVYSAQRDDASAEGKGDVSNTQVRVAGVPTGVPHLERACELLWQRGHPAVAESLQGEVEALVAERQQAIDERDHFQAQSSQWHAKFSQSLTELDTFRDQLQQAIDALREAQHQCRENIRRAAFAPEIGTRYTEKLRLAIADECRKLEDGIGAALLSLGEQP